MAANSAELVSRAEPHREHRGLQGKGAVGVGDAELSLLPGGEGLFELFGDIGAGHLVFPDHVQHGVFDLLVYVRPGEKLPRDLSLHFRRTAQDLQSVFNHILTSRAFVIALIIPPGPGRVNAEKAGKTKSQEAGMKSICIMAV